MIDNPFAVLERRLNRLEFLLLEIKEASTPHQESKKSDRCSLIEALEITGLSKSKLYKLTAANEIPHRRFNNRLVFSRKELEAWFEAEAIAKNSNSEVSLSLARSARKKRA